MSTAQTDLHTFHQAAEVPRAGWSALLRAEDLYLGARWLEVAERTAGCPMHYFVLNGDDGTPVAGLATALADERAPWVLGRPDTLLRFSADDDREGAADVLAALSAPPAEALLPSLVCGGRHMGRSRVPLATGAGRAETEKLVEQAQEFAARHGARSVAFPFVEESDVLLRDVLERRGYLRHASGRYSSLRLPSGGFDAYLATLSGKRRRTLPVERRKIRAAGVTLRVEPLSASWIPRLGELEAQLMAKYGVTWQAAQTEQVLHEMLGTFGEDAQIVLAEGDGDIRGFATLLRHRDHWFARQSGFDYAYQGNLPLYFETVYYYPVEVAERFGIKAIHYGLGTEEAKRSRGCVAETQYAYLLPLDR
ncbi:GNAT family N-acetyltransferase [Streptomyces sp. NPDC047046]|uniref:GNAT family N-acetyltransferase n=1 Tax=Streptomyces sp. NPDC047046 TaxID=3155378 RepID=UPI0033BFB95C